ncbi:hypothetical protein ACW7BJ_33135 [Azospirillum argentinense]
MPIITISIYDGEQLLERRDCRAILLPDQRTAVLWRGLAYPLLEGDRVDIAGEAVIPTAVPPAPAASTPPVARFAVVEGVGEAYLLIQGSVLDREQAAARLAAGGIPVIRSGQYLGEPVDGLAADWFVRFESQAVAPGALAARIGALLEGALLSAEGPANMAALRLRLVEGELARAHAAAASLKAEVVALRLALAQRAPADAQDEAWDRADRLQADFAELQRTLVEESKNRLAAEALALEAPPLPRPAAPGRLSEEVAAVFASLLPRIRLLRASLDVAAVEFSDRRFLYGALAELAAGTGGTPANWKKVKGADRWWERHISNGQDDAGRIYARLDPEDRRWEVLVSHKSEQPRDIAWLRSRG